MSFVPLEGEAPTATLLLLWRRDDDREVLRSFLGAARSVAKVSR